MFSVRSKEALTKGQQYCFQDATSLKLMAFQLKDEQPSAKWLGAAWHHLTNYNFYVQTWIKQSQGYS